MGLSEKDLEYFKKGETDNKKFFERLNGEPDFTGLKVLDVGCGHGSLCIYAAERNAAKVVGLDIDERRINFANENLMRNYPHLQNCVEFKHCTVEELLERDFDLILSKDAFEHIIGPDDCLKEMARRLKHKGRILIGFGPLYNSPYGDHHGTKSMLPWGHLTRTKKSILKSANKNRDIKISSVYDLGLNMLPLREYKRLFYGSGLDVKLFRVNANEKLISKVMTALSKIPFLTEYFSHNLYCILERL
ncbi:MAG: class I SAM-dependent methyltransferase [Oscillospiraceae bacterium]|nr:class I SAM-dependent methyltransferase [Oscillospiraceae bacterium]